MFDNIISFVTENWIVLCIAGSFLAALYTVTEIARRAEMKKEAQKKEVGEATKKGTSESA